MRIPGLGRLERVAWRIRSRFVRGALILLYHRVTELPSDPNLLAVTPQHFAAHLEVLRKHARPVRLQQLSQDLHKGSLPSRAVAVTFDDGYADNLYNAKPLLERYDIPATVFITTGYIGHGREFWWDELNGLLLQPETLPESLCLSINSITYQWELGEGDRSHEFSSGGVRKVSPREAYGPSSRLQLFRSLLGLLRPLPENQRREVLNELLAWSGHASTVRPTHRPLAPEEVVRLAEGGLIEVGAHTVTHPVLASLPVALQRKEIVQSKTYLENILGTSVNSFAYPFGFGSNFYTPESVVLVRQAGFSCACSAHADIVWRRTDRFRLPRIAARSWDGEEFARRLRTWCRD